jgi:Flp pilus assembly pilin Flp
MRYREKKTPPAVLEGILPDETGVTAIEYACIAGLVAIAVLALVAALGAEVNVLFTSVLGGL